VVAGVELARYGDVLAEKTGMGRTWIGLVLLAATTSLPELFTGVGSSLVYALPDIAVGDVLGSAMFNLLIISLMDAVGGGVPISARAQQGHALSIGFGLLLVGIVGGALVAGGELPVVGWVGVYTPIVIVVYLAAMRLLFRHERRRFAAQAEQVAEELAYRETSVRKAATRYGLGAVVVIVAATFLPRLGEQIADETGLGQAFVGTLFIALTTSLPEVVVSLAAVRLGAIDLAVGNVLGSNLFNMVILGVDDVLYTRGSLLENVDPSQLLAVLAVIAMYSLLLVGLTYQVIKKRLVLAWDTAGILVVYGVSIWLLFRLTSGP
jgi:cation:H+ antiporter